MTPLPIMVGLVVLASMLTWGTITLLRLRSRARTTNRFLAAHRSMGIGRSIQLNSAVEPPLAGSDEQAGVR